MLSKIAAHRWKILLPACLALPVLLWWTLHAGRDPDEGKLRLTVLDVGQGDSLLLQTPSGRSVLIDGGGSIDESQAGATDVGERVVVPALHALGVRRVDILLLTHPHGDHVGGLLDVLRDEPVGIVLDGTRLPYPSEAYAAFLRQVRDERLPYRHVVRGMHIDMADGVTLDVLNPPAVGYPYGVGDDNATVNNYSCVLRVTDGKTHFMLEGDAEEEAEQSMMASCGDLRADVLKCGHHGAANATSDAFLDEVQPTYAAISCGYHNVFGHPNPATLARLNAHRVIIYRTDLDGAVRFVSDGRTVVAQRLSPGANSLDAGRTSP